MTWYQSFSNYQKELFAGFEGYRYLESSFILRECIETVQGVDFESKPRKFWASNVADQRQEYSIGSAGLVNGFRQDIGMLKLN